MRFISPPRAILIKLIHKLQNFLQIKKAVSTEDTY